MVELPAAVPGEQVALAVEDLAAVLVEGAAAVLDGAADAAGEGDVIAVPAGDLLLLEVLGGQVALPDVGGEGVPVGLAGPALEVHQGGLAEDRVVVPDVLLAVADEADDLRVEALVGGAAVVEVVGPVGPEGRALELVGPLGGDVPALRLDGPHRLVGDPAVRVVDVDVERGEVGVGLVAELLEAAGEVAAVDVPALVDVVALVEPVPAGLGPVDQGLAEVLRLGVRLGGVHVDAEAGVPLPALLEEGVEVGEAAGALVVVAAVVGVGGVVALGAVPLEQGELAESVGGERDPLDVVQGAQEGVGGLGGEVERDVGDDPAGGLLAAGGLDPDRAEGDGAVLPVDGAVGVGVGGDDDLGPGQGVAALGLRGALAAVGPLAGPDADAGLGAVPAGLVPEAGGVAGGGAGGLVVAGVGLDGGGEAAGADDRVGGAGGARLGRGGVGDPREDVGGTGGVRVEAGEGGGGAAGVRGADGDQVVAGYVDGPDPEGLGVADGGDPEGGGPAVDAQPRVDLDAGQVGQDQGVRGGGRGQDGGGLGPDGAGGAVEDDLGDRGRTAEEAGAARAVGVREDAGEVLGDGDGELPGGDDGARGGVRGGVRGGPGGRGPGVGQGRPRQGEHGGGGDGERAGRTDPAASWRVREGHAH